MSRKSEVIEIKDIKIPDLKVLKDKNYNFYDKYTKKKLGNKFPHKISTIDENNWNTIAHRSLRVDQENQAMLHEQKKVQIMMANGSPNFRKFKADHKAGL